MVLLLLILGVSGLFAQKASVEDPMRLVAEGRIAEAESILRGLTEKNPRDVDLRYRLGLVLLKQKNLDEAERVLKEAIKIDPNFAFAWLALGDIHFRRNDRITAIADAKHAASLAGDSVVAWRALAVLQDRIGDGNGLAQSLQSLIRLTPDDRESRVRLAGLLLEHRNAATARAVAGEGLKRLSNDAELLRLQGLALYGLGHKPEAIDSFLAAMDAAPNDEIVHTSIETLIPDAGDRLPQISERLKRFNSQRPDSPLGLFLLALTVTDDKAALLRQAIAVDPKFWPAHFELARLLRDQGRAQDGVAELETTLQLNPNHEGAHFALAELYLEAGDRQKARQHRVEHHRLRAAAAAGEQQRAADAPRFTIKTQ